MNYERSDEKNEREKIRKISNRSLIERLMSSAPKNDRVKKNRIFPEIDSESFGTPMTYGSNCLEISTSFSKGSSASWSKRLSGEVVWEEITQSRNKPVAGGYTATWSEPEFWVQREKAVSRVDVGKKMNVRIGGRCKFLHENSVAFKCLVTFVRG